MDHVGQVATIIKDHVQRLAVGEDDGLLDAPIELFFGHAFPSINGNASGSDRSSSWIMCRENVTAGPSDFSTQFDQRFDQHSRLNGHVKATSNASTGEWFCFAVLLAKGHQSRHFVFSQFDFAAA